MFVRRLLVSAVLASLAACAAPTSTFVVDKNPNLKQRTTIGSVDALDYQLMPKRESAAFSATVSTQNANSTALCLQQHLSSEFKLPPEFISHKVYTDNNHSVGLINPFTKVEGITMDVVNKGSSSEIKLYDNGNLLSRAWKQLPSKCGQGKTTTLAQDTGSKTKTTAPAQSGVDFIAASKAENKPAVALAASTPAVIKAVPAIKATPARIIQDSTPAIPLQAAKAVSASPSSAFNTSNTAPVLATAAKESSINTPVARSSFTQETPAPTNFVARTDESTSDSARWDHGDLTQDDMSIIAPATAAVVTPAMAIAAKSMASNDNNNSNANAVKASSSRTATSSKPTTTSKAAESSKPKTSSKKPAESQEKATNNRGKTTAANANNSKQTAKDKANNSRNKADDNKANSKNSRTKATEKADKAENTKNSRTKNSKAAAAEEKNSSKAKNSRNKAQDKDDNKTSKGKKTNERNVKADKNDDNNKTNNKKASAKNNDSGKNNKKTTQERDNSSKAKASGNKSKATDKKAESAKKAPKKDKAK